MIGTRAILLLVAAFSLGAEPETAEYAFRWEPAMGGPATVDAVHRVLGGGTKAVRSFAVRYHRLPEGCPRPAGSTAIFRERIPAGEPAEYRLKFRRTTPFGSGDACPDGLESSYEKDVSFLRPDSVRGVYSLSCTGSEPSWPRRLGSEPLGCRSTVERHQGKKYRVEVWTLPGRKVLIEVSHRAGNDRDDQRDFAERVRKLMDAGARPTPESKTEMGMDCGE